MSDKNVVNYEHLVISGGGVDGLILYGAIKEFIEKGYLDMNIVKTIHAVSAGALISTMLLLGYSVDDMDDYVIKRPWENVFKLNGFSFRNIMMKKGLIDSSMIVEIVRPLLEARDISPNVTLADFELHTKVRLFMYTVDLNIFPLNAIELSAKSHPNMPLSMALSMTCCYPMIFTPVMYAGGCYVDGGLVTKCPVHYCTLYTRSNGIDLDRILVFNSISSPKYKRIDERTPMIDYMRHIVEHMNHSIVCRCDDVLVKNVVECFNADFNSLNAWFQCMNDRNKRQAYVYAGSRFSELFLNKGMS